MNGGNTYDTTLLFRMAPGYWASVDRSTFIYDDAGTPIAYYTLQDYGNFTDNNNYAFTDDKTMIYQKRLPQKLLLRQSLELSIIRF